MRVRRRSWSPRFGLSGLALALALAAGCAGPEPLHKLVERTDRDVGSRLGVKSDVGSLLADPAIRPDLAKAGAELPPTLTLRAAQELALRHNLSLSAAAESLPIAQFALVQAGLLSNPTLGQSNGLLFPVKPVLGGAAQFDVNITVTLNSIFTRGARVGVAEAQRLQAGVDLAATEFELAMKVEDKFHEVMYEDRSLQIAERISETYQRAVRAAEIEGRVGVIPMPEVNRARVNAEDAKRQIAKLQIRRRQSVRDLNFLMGVPEESQWALEASPSLAAYADLGVADAQARNLAPRFRLDVAHTRLDEQAAREGVRLAEAGLIPAITIGPEAAYTPGSPSSWVLGPTISVELPIFDDHRTALRSAQASLRQAMKTTVSAEAQAQADAVAAVHAIETAASDVEFYRERIIPQQRENVRIAQTAFQQGQIDLGALLNTLRDAASAEQAAADAGAALEGAIVGLQRALGISLGKAREALASDPTGAGPPPATDANTQAPADSASPDAAVPVQVTSEIKR